MGEVLVGSGDVVDALLSGGSAQIAPCTRVRPEDSGAPKDGWIGKDLGHAFDELAFYEAAQAVRDDKKWRLPVLTQTCMGERGRESD